MRVLSETRTANILALLLPLAVAATFSLHSLQKGQAIKQFEAYSIAESLALAPLGVLSTTIPCDGKTPWTLEPPVFHELGALGIRLWPDFPAAAPLAIYLLLLGGIFRLSSHLMREPKQRVLFVWLVALTPAFCRYSIQFVPDVLAAALLLGSVNFFLVARSRRGFALLSLAVLTKVLIFPAVPFILYWRSLELENGSARISKRRAAFCAVVQSTFVVLPFLAWVLIVGLSRANNVLQSQGMIHNYLLEGWGQLLEPGIYARFFTWIVVQGTGLVLFAFAAFSIFKRTQAGSNVRLLKLWILGLLPFWIFVRQGNRVHDYYSLSYILPLSVLGARALVTGEGFGLNRRVIKAALIGASLALGILSLAGQDPVPMGPGQIRPHFCGSEMRRISPALKAAPGLELREL